MVTGSSSPFSRLVFYPLILSRGPLGHYRPVRKKTHITFGLPSHAVKKLCTSSTTTGQLSPVGRSPRSRERCFSKYFEDFGAVGRTEMASSSSSSSLLATDDKQQSRKISLQLPAVINKMGRKLSSSVGGSGLFSSSGGSLNNLAVGQQQLGGSIHDSDEELNRQFADFDTYVGGFDPRPPAAAAPAVPIILLHQSEEEEGGIRRRTRSESRPSFPRFLKLSRRRGSQSESPSPTSPNKSLEFLPLDRRSSSSSGTLGVATPVLKCSLEQLPEGVQVHHASGGVGGGTKASPDELDGSWESDTPKHVRSRSATFTWANRRPVQQSEMLGPAHRERSVSFSASGPLLLPPDRTKKRRSLGSILFWPAFGRSRYTTTCQSRLLLLLLLLFGRPRNHVITGSISHSERATLLCEEPFMMPSTFFFSRREEDTALA